MGLSDTKGVISQGQTLEELKQNLLNAARLNGHHRVRLVRKFQRQKRYNPVSPKNNQESQSLDGFFEKLCKLNNIDDFLSESERALPYQDRDPFQDF